MKLNTRLITHKPKFLCGIVGSGNVVGHHIEALCSLRHIKLNVIMGSNADIIIDRFQNLALSKATNFKELCEKSDILLIANENQMHAHLALEALRLEKGALIEKPLGIDEDSCQELIHTNAEDTLPLSIVSQRRYDRFIQNLKKWLKKNVEKKLNYGLLEFCWPRNKNYFSDHHLWRAKKDISGGGCLMMHGIHFVDVMIYLFGKPEAVTCKCSKTTHLNIEVEDTFKTEFFFKDDFRFGINGSIADRNPIPFQFKLETENLEIYANHDFYKIGRKKKNINGNLIDMWKDYENLLLEEENCVPTLKEGLWAVQCVLAAYEANKKGKKVWISH